MLKDSCGQRLGRRSMSWQGNTFALCKPGFRGTADSRKRTASWRPRSLSAPRALNSPGPAPAPGAGLRALHGGTQQPPNKPLPLQAAGQHECRWAADVWVGRAEPLPMPPGPHGAHRAD